MTETLSREVVLDLARRALDGGERWLVDTVNGVDRYRPTIEWDVAGRCTAPVPVERFSRWSTRVRAPAKDALGVLREQANRPMPVLVRLQTRCRLCMWCKQQRRHHWADRAGIEWADASRTWLVTLTGAPEFHTRCLAQARLRVAGRIGRKGELLETSGPPADDFDGLPDREKFSALVREEGQELTRYIKRLREDLRYKRGFRVPFRYLCTVEAHKSGWPHFHMLLHERGVHISKDEIQRHWEVGFSNAKVVYERDAATYVCKYLAKDARTRVRASFAYGQCGTQTFEENSVSMSA